jgi:ArsR family transcriptional regulator, zinc-responsive transcriptional repressor
MNLYAEANVSSVQTVVRRQLDVASELLKTLAAPVRLAILVELEAGPRCVHELVSALDVSQPLVSQHLRVLRGGRLVAAERRGREVVYRLVDEHVGHIVRDAIRHSEEDRP